MSSTAECINLTKEAVIFGDPHLRTDGDLLAMCYDADGNLWSVEEPGVVRQWDSATGEAVETFTLSDLETLWFFGPHASLLASASDDLSIWDPKTGNLLVAIAQESWVTSVALHPNLWLAATGHDDGKIRIWDVKTEKLVHQMDHHREPISALCFKADGSQIAAASEDKQISLWNTETAGLVGVLEGHKDRIPQLEWHPSGHSLVSAAWDTTIRIWYAHSREPMILLNYHDTQVYAMTFSPDGKVLASADSANTIHLWDFDNKKVLHRINEGKNPSRFLAYSPDGTQLASGGGALIRLWDPYQGQPLSQGTATPPERISVSVNSRFGRLATQSGAGIQLWDSNTGKAAETIAESMPVLSIAYSPDGKWLAGGMDDRILLWDAATGALRHTLQGPHEPITTLAFSADGTTLASGSSVGMAVWIWRCDDGEPILLIPDPLDGCTVEGLVFLADKRRLAVTGIDPLVQAEGDSTGATSIWDLEERCEIATFPGGARGVASHPTGKQLATASLDQSVCIWDVNSQQLLVQQLLVELSGHSDAVNAVCYSPDGKWLASGADDWTIRLWDTAAWEEKAVGELDSQIKKLIFSPDGKSLFAAAGNATCYRLKTSQLLGAR